MTIQTVIRRNQLPAILGISLATIDRLRVSRNFPTPIKLGEQAVGWTLASIQEWIASRPICSHFMEAI